MTSIISIGVMLCLASLVCINGKPKPAWMKASKTKSANVIKCITGVCLEYDKKGRIISKDDHKPFLDVPDDDDNSSTSESDEEEEDDDGPDAEETDEAGEGEVMVEGDMRMDKNDVSSKTAKKFRNAITWNGKWNNTIYIMLHQDYTKLQKDIIKGALTQMSEKLQGGRKKKCITFKFPRTAKKANTDYISIEPGKGCSSPVGKRGGKQVVSLAKQGCFYHLGTIQHEVMHSMGFYHEQSRSDRDKYITIEWDNIQQGYTNNFVMATYDFHYVGYDYKSVLHYKNTAYSKDPRKYKTIIPKDPSAYIGQRQGLSEGDCLEIQKMYGCKQTCTDPNPKDGGGGRSGNGNDNEPTTPSPLGPPKIRTFRCTFDNEKPGSDKCPFHKSDNKTKSKTWFKIEDGGSGHHPQYERTNFKFMGGKYWYIDGATANDKDVIAIKSDVIYPGSYCLRIAYWVYRSKSRVQVYMTQMAEPVYDKNNPNDAVSMMHGKQVWNVHTIHFDETNPNIIEIIVTIMKSEDSIGDFAIDEIKLAERIEGQCQFQKLL